MKIIFTVLLTLIFVSCGSEKASNTNEAFVDKCQNINHVVRCQSTDYLSWFWWVRYWKNNPADYGKWINDMDGGIGIRLDDDSTGTLTYIPESILSGSIARSFGHKGCLIKGPGFQIVKPGEIYVEGKIKVRGSGSYELQVVVDDDIWERKTVKFESANYGNNYVPSKIELPKFEIKKARKFEIRVCNVKLLATKRIPSAFVSPVEMKVTHKFN